MSKHEIPVIEVKLEPHPGADALSLVRIDGYVVVVKTADWKDGDLAAYIPPDYVVPKNETFAFLGDHLRIKSRKFRGIYSEGLLIKALPDMKVGDCAMEKLGTTRYEPPMDLSSDGENENGPSLIAPVYDMENYKKYNYIITSNDKVSISEKIHGCNSRFVFHKGRMWCGSHRNWKKQSDKNLWWKALSLNNWIEAWCIHHEDHILFSETYGQVQDLKYGTARNELKVAVFDIMHKGQWANWDEFKKLKTGLDCVPLLYEGFFDEKLAKDLAEGDSSIFGANHLREGVVIKTQEEKFHPKIGRIILKLVSSRYLSS